jgi:hypothetical protein
MSRLETQTKAQWEVRVLTGEELKAVRVPGAPPWPEDTVVLAACTPEGRIVGQLAMIALPHLEGLWIDPDFRGGHLLKSLVGGMEQLGKVLGRTHLFAFVPEDSSEVEDYTERLNFNRFPVKVYMKEI